MGQEEKVQLLMDVLVTRLRYMRRWNNVSLDLGDNDVSITWCNDDNASSFEKITYFSSVIFIYPFLR